MTVIFALAGAAVLVLLLVDVVQTVFVPRGDAPLRHFGDAGR